MANNDKKTPQEGGKNEVDTARIAKVIARSGLCSRREAERLITDGAVKVNGKKITSPALNVTQADIVTVRGRPLSAPEPVRLWRYHKPKGLVTSHKDPEGRPTVFESLQTRLPRVISVGRLDINTEGLLLVTTDGALARYLELPSTGWIRRYRVRANGHLTQANIEKLGAGMTVDGVHYGAVEAQVEKDQGSNSWISLALKEGKNREIKKLLAAFGLQVSRLIRVSYGPFHLGSLAKGQVDEIKPHIIANQIDKDLAIKLQLKKASTRRKQTPNGQTQNKRPHTQRKPRAARK